MKIIGLDDKEYSWNYKQSQCSSESRSKLHLRARDLISKMFPYDITLEEVLLPGCGKSILYADFYLPLRKIMIEVNGQQHSKYVHFYHKEKLNFYKGVNRDKKKKEWCEKNGITLISLNFDQTDEQWEHIINAR